MFSPLQLKWWTTSHLKLGAWYLNCPPEFTPLLEDRLKRFVDFLDAPPEYEEFAGLDEASRARAVKKREEVDKKIALRNSEAIDKAQERATKKTAKLAQKEKVPAKEKNLGRTSKQPMPMSSTVDQGSQLQTSTS